MKNKFFIAVLLPLILSLTSCATVPKRPVTSHRSTRPNIVHTIAPGENFWRISKMYNVSIATILQANRLKKSSKLKMGQKLLIPHAGSIRPVISLYPSRKWKYIIIHHSATKVGNSLSFHQAHLDRGWDKGVGYHFIIDNRSSGKQDGQIEVSPRWLKQQDGAHCKASDMNTKAIGISLVGNFSNDRVSPKQMQSLVYLTKTLKNYYRIPTRNILRHSHVRRAQTVCPGTRFPWWQFMNNLKR